MPEELRAKAALIAAALGLVLTVGVAVAWNAEPPAERVLASGEPAGRTVSLSQPPPPDAPPLLPSPSPSAAPVAAPPAPPAALRAFDACGELLTWIRGTAERLVTPYGLPGGHGVGSGVAVGGSGGALTGGPAPWPPGSP